ncbi:MAG: Type II/IV secretion system ATPase TadZ/CpaE, associated with Flp pilus assembly [Candidatus Carbobacillus altaicus]|uniref:Type II/IV secretion system ATPase TadZ/CpaE, associated with Flp pilus assembly n=1 Tax=Candidatus Carbonibacillus altaicus TaxID=2163959 RepID=A0A2R6Y528_9BACL|nr:MAG: Type II/IV secretion system ATPase TadZ/CpaE, associated with Flp pilus assembly [Candidatus Carbobacillus altaicus]
MNLILLSGTEDIKNMIKAQAAERSWTIVESTMLHVLNDVERERPEAVIYVWDPELGLEPLAYLRQELTQPILFITEERQASFIRDAFRLGATDVLIFPEEAGQFTDRTGKVVDRWAERQAKVRREEIAPEEKRRAHILSFYSGSGGAGRSLLAATFAQTMRIETGAETLLVDLNIQYGAVEQFLGLEQSRPFTELKAVIHELSELHIKSVVSRLEDSGLELFGSPKDDQIVSDWTEADIRQLLRAFRTYYSLIVVDLPVEIDVLSYTALQLSDEIIYVLTADLPGLRAFRRARLYLESLGIDVESKMRVIINKQNATSPIKVSHLKKMLSTPIDGVVRDDHRRVHARILHGVPIRRANERPRNAVARDVRQWAVDAAERLGLRPRRKLAFGARGNLIERSPGWRKGFFERLVPDVLRSRIAAQAREQEELARLEKALNSKE